MSRLCSACLGPIAVHPRSYDRARSFKRLRWCSKFRGIIEYSDSQCKLSGVSRIDTDYVLRLYVPYNRNDFCEYRAIYGDTAKQPDDHLLLQCSVGAPVPTSGPKCDHVVHAYCWDVIERVIGPQAEERLDLLLQALVDGWDKNSHDVQGLISSSHGGWLGGMKLENITHQYRLIPVTDPVEIPALQKLVAKCTKDEVEEASRETTTEPIGSTVTSGPGTLPMEIQVMVFNMLPEWDDINNAVEAFSIQLPDFLWREWFPHDLIFDELEQIPNYRIDWKAFWEGVMRLLDISLAMKNRQRIVRVVKEIREDFLRLLEQDPRNA